MKKWLKIVLPFFLISTLIAWTTPIIVSCSSNQPPPNPTPQPPPLPEKELNPAGGTTTTGLKVSGFLETIEFLNLKLDTTLNELTNESLTNKISNQLGYSDMSLRILDGSSEKQGLLKLNLSGSFNNKSYNQNIDITGFKTNQVKSTYIFAKPIELNKQLWFDNFQPISGLTMITNYTNDLNLLTQIFSNTEVQFNINNQDVVYRINELPNSIKIANISIDKSNNNLLLNLDFKKQIYYYENNQWIIDENDSVIRIQTNADKSFTQPNFNDLKLFILDQMSLNEDELKNYYSSYFYGQYLYDVKNDNYLNPILGFIKDADIIINKYQSKYCPSNNLYLSLTKDNSMIASDSNYSLSFSICLIDQNNPDDYSVNKELRYNGFKDISIINNKQYQNEFHLKESSVLAKFIKKNYADQLYQASNGDSVSATLKELPTNIRTIYNYDSSSNANINNLNNTFYSMQIYNQPLSFNDHQNYCEPNNLNINTSLYTISNENDSFVIRNISFNKISNLKINFTKKSSNNGVNVDIETSIEIYLEGGNPIVQPTNIHISFLSSELNPN